MERAVPVIPVDDLTQAKQFYVDGLGFEVSFEASEDGKSGLLGVRRGSIAITLDSPMDGHGRDACVSLEVENADRYYDEWSRRVSGQRPPKNEEWGARTFSVTDPFGIRGCGDDLRELLHDGHPTACVGDAAFAYIDAFTLYAFAKNEPGDLTPRRES